MNFWERYTPSCIIIYYYYFINKYITCRCNAALKMYNIGFACTLCDYSYNIMYNGNGSQSHLRCYVHASVWEGDANRLILPPSQMTCSVQSSLRTKDTLGTGLLSFVRRLSLSRRFMISQSILIVLSLTS